MTYPVKESSFSVQFQLEFSFARGCSGSGWLLLTPFLVIPNHTGWARGLHWKRVPPSSAPALTSSHPLCVSSPVSSCLPKARKAEQKLWGRATKGSAWALRVHPQHVEKVLVTAAEPLKPALHRCVEAGTCEGPMGKWKLDVKLLRSPPQFGTPMVSLLWEARFQQTVTLTPQPVRFSSHWGSNTTAIIGSVLIQGRKKVPVWDSFGSWIAQKLFTMTMQEQTLLTSCTSFCAPEHHHIPPCHFLVWLSLSYFITPMFLIYKYVSP